MQEFTCKRIGDGSMRVAGLYGDTGDGPHAKRYGQNTMQKQDEQIPILRDDGKLEFVEASI